MILRRLVAVIPVMLGATVVVFALLELAPGDPTSTMLGLSASDASREALRESLGLNASVPERYAAWLSAIVTGDFGMSLELRRPVLPVLMDRLRATFLVAVPAGGLALAFGSFFGLLAGLRIGSRFDRLTLGVSMVGLSLPSYWVSVVLIIVFGVVLGWLPTGGRGPISVGGGSGFAPSYLILPVAATFITPAVIVSRVVRSATAETISRPFVESLRMRGLGAIAVTKHVARNVFPTALNIGSLQFGYLLLGSALFVEVIFQWPGLGYQTYAAVQTRDFPMLAGIVLITAFLFAIINLATDVAVRALDPRSARK